MPRTVLTDEKQIEARRRYYADGVEEMRQLLEREFKRTHPSGDFNFNCTTPINVNKRPK
jgi:hypothetical protein